MNGVNQPQQPVNPEPMQPPAAAPQSGGSSWIAWIIGIVLVILVGGGLYYYYQYIKIPELQSQLDTLQNQVNTLQEQVKATEETSNKNDLNYQNEKYGFKLTFTQAFSGFIVEEEKPNDNYSLAYLRVWVSTTSTKWNSTKEGYADPITFSIYTSSNWEKQQNQEGATPSLVGRTDDYVVGYSTWQDCPEDLCGKITKSEIEKVINTFKKI